MRRAITSHTTGYIGGTHVDYVSVNVEGDGRVSVHVREGDKGATVHMSKGEWAIFLLGALKAGVDGW